LKPHLAQLLDSAILVKDEDFAALEEEWEDLYQNSPRATPFQSWAWLYSWWESYGEGYELRLISVRDDAGLLVGLIPLMLERRGAVGRLLFVGTGITDHLDVLAREGWEEGVAEAGVRALQGMDSWHVADLQEVCPTATAWKVFRNWTGLRLCVWQSNCVVADIKPWEELLMSVKKSLRKMARRSVRRAEEDGVRCELAAAVDAEGAARRFVTLHREQWGEQDVFPEHLTQRFESHLAAATRRMTDRDSGGMFEYWRDAEAIASCFLVWKESNSVGMYLTGANADAHERYQISSLYMHTAVDVDVGRNSSSVDLLRGEEPYKLLWNAHTIANQRLILGNRLIAFGPYAGYLALRSRATRYVKSGHAPPWVAEIATRLHRLLSR